MVILHFLPSIFGSKINIVIILLLVYASQHCKLYQKNYQFAVKRRYYMAFPTKQAEINALLQIWLIKLPNWATLYGLSNETVKQHQDDAIMYKHLIDVLLQLESDKHELQAYRNNIFSGNAKGTAADYPTVGISPLPALAVGVKPGIIERNREFYNFLKGHPNKTTESLADLGIITATPPKIAIADLRPSLKVTAKINDRVEVSFSKQSQPAIRLQMRRSTADWISLGDPTNSPFTDNTASTGNNPEKREYRGVYLLKNEIIGQYSDIVVIVTTP
jgi:hypothetical protein